MNPNQTNTITTRDQAITFAIDWQNWQSTQSLYMSELLEWQRVFTLLALKFDLLDEFQENGII